MRAVWILACVFFCLPGRAQVSAARAALARLEKKEFNQARTLLVKAMRKDAGPAQYYVWARYFAEPRQPFSQIDSAHAYAQRAQQAWQGLTPAGREALAKLPLDSLSLHRLQQHIDSLAFERARMENSEAAYRFFLERFPAARQRAHAAQLSAEVRFLEALRQNTIEAYRLFLTDYPQSPRTAEAGERLEQLQFDEGTKSGRLKDLVRFYQSHPANRFREAALNKIFLIQTASGQAGDLQKFLDQYPNTPQASKAAALLLYIDSAAHLTQHLPDSVRLLMRLNQGYWVPFLRDGKYGFLNAQAEVAMPERFTSIPITYRCGPVTSDIISGDQHLYLRNGKRISDRPVTAVHDLGAGFVLLDGAGHKSIVHKTGFTFLSGVNDAKPVGSNFLAVRRADQWSLVALNGMELLPGPFDDVGYHGTVFILTRRGKKILVTLQEALAAAEGVAPAYSLVYDEVKPWPDGRLWVKNGSLEGVLSDALQFEIPLGRFRLTRTSFGMLQTADGTTAATGLSPAIDGQKYRSIHIVEPWMVLRNPPSASLFSIAAKKMLAVGLDSVWFSGRNAWATRSDSTFLFSATQPLAGFAVGAVPEFIASADSIRSFAIAERGKKNVFLLATGKSLFSTSAQIIGQAGSYFIVSDKNKKGLLDDAGRTVLPPEYDQIVFQPPAFFSLVKNKQFGWYDAVHRKLVKPAFDRNLSALSAHLIVSGKAGKKGVVNRDGAEVLPFAWDEIKPWRDSLLWVQNGGYWKLLNVFTGATYADRVRAFRPVAEAGNERLVWIRRDTGEGIISDRRGEVIPATFSEVFNAGTVQQPLFVASREIREAGMMVIAHFTREGRLARRQACEIEAWDDWVCDE
jgi:hypothetical protein